MPLDGKNIADGRVNSNRQHRKGPEFMSRGFHEQCKNLCVGRESKGGRREGDLLVDSLRD